VQFKFDIYQRRFIQPLRTSHGIWQVREGIIISLSDDQTSKISQGEIAPLPWFGSETMTQALQFCQQLGATVTEADIAAIPDTLPACQFAFESAFGNLSGDDQQNKNNYPDLNYCYLLPAGKEALTTSKSIYNDQFPTTFKWKIGVYPLATEITILRQLVASFPAQTKLRLDANGGLNLQQTKKLLEVTDNMPALEFIEQPLPGGNFDEMLALANDYSTLLALDESVANFNQLKAAHQQGWQGIFIIKAAIMGFPSRLRQFCQDNYIDAVFSSVFETEIGRQAVLRLAQELSNHNRAIGFGVKHWFESKSD
jgi:o-succinylbenzoate synthase